MIMSEKPNPYREHYEEDELCEDEGAAISLGISRVRGTGHQLRRGEAGRAIGAVLSCCTDSTEAVSDRRKRPLPLCRDGGI